MKTKDQYIGCLTLKLKEWDTQINQLTTDVDNDVVNLAELKVLRSKQHVAVEKMKELQEARDDAWVLVARTANEAWDDLRRSIANSKLRQTQNDFAQW